MLPGSGKVQGAAHRGNGAVAVAATERSAAEAERGGIRTGGAIATEIATETRIGTAIEGIGIGGRASLAGTRAAVVAGTEVTKIAARGVLNDCPVYVLFCVWCLW